MPDPEGRAIEHLLAAVRLSPDLPRLGRWHLRMLGTVALRRAVERAIQGDAAGYDAALAALEELLARRRTTLEDMLYEVVRDGEVRDYVRLSEAYEFTHRILQGIQQAKVARSRADARAGVEAYEQTLGESEFRDLLGKWAARG